MSDYTEKVEAKDSPTGR